MTPRGVTIPAVAGVKAWPEANMAHRAFTIILLLITIPSLAPPSRAQQSPANPFTQDQVQAMVRDGLADETGAKALGQRGMDFAPAEDFIQSLRTAGASDAFIPALRAAKHPGPVTAKKPINQIQVFALPAGQVPSHRVTLPIQERGIDVEAGDEYLRDVRVAGGEEELVGALRHANRQR